MDSWEVGTGAEKERVEREMRRVVRRVPVGKCMFVVEVEGEVEIKLELEIVGVEEALPERIVKGRYQADFNEEEEQKEVRLANGSN